MRMHPAVWRWALCIAALAALSTAQSPKEIAGTVRDASGPVSGATVRAQATTVAAQSGAAGGFTLRGLPDRISVALTAWAPGYYIAGPVTAKPGDAGVVITLKRHTQDDDPSYSWVSALSSAGREGNCQNCHASVQLASSGLPFDEWQIDAHGTSAQNRRFLSMYNGTDLSGENHSPPTRYFPHKDYGLIPLPPETGQPYFGPGFKLDFPGSAGDCAACHAPAAAIDAPYDTDPSTVTGVGREGVTCDFCHKVWSVRLDTSSGVPYGNAPGVLSFEFRRPPSTQQFFAGPYDDVAPGEDTYSALQNQSQFCAPCHFAKFWGVQVYNSFGEWLASPYSNPVKGQTCQDCHMPRRGATLAARADKGGLVRDSKTVFSHLMPGAKDQSLLENTAGLAIEARQSGDLLHVAVSVTNEKAGHHIPTDHPSRNILLVVSATDSRNKDLLSIAGPVVPDWGGTGPAPEDYGGKPGRGYAKILEELWTQVAPTAAYWNPCVLREDTRIPALGKDTSEYDFLAPAEGGPVRITARLVFRRAFRQLSLWKQWNDSDILMEQSAVTLAATPPAAKPLAAVHAATLKHNVALAPESVVTVYGTGLASATFSKAVSTGVAGTRVVARDRLGKEADASLTFVSPEQVNFVLPGGLAAGAAVLKAMRGNQLAGATQITLAPVAPGVFAADGKQSGPAAAVVVYVARDGTQITSPAFTCRAVGNCSTLPISLQPQIARAYLLLFGTGIRGLSSIAGVKLRIGDVDVPVLSAGSHARFPGLDQVNVELPESVAGKGEVPVALTVDGIAANTVFVSFR